MCSEAKPGTARGIVLIENNRTRVTEWRFAVRDDNTGWHRHHLVVTIGLGILVRAILTVYTAPLPQWQRNVGDQSRPIGSPCERKASVMAFDNRRDD